MNALFIIDGLPVEDRRAKEALRIAAGTGVWGKVKITVGIQVSPGKPTCTESWKCGPAINSKGAHRMV